MTLTRSLPTQHASGLPLIDERRITAGRFARNADGTSRVGVLPGVPGVLVTGRASMGYDVAPFNAVTARTAAGAEEIANDGSVTVTTTAAPGSNSRIDVIWVRAQFQVLGDANNDVVFGVTQGTAAVSPSKPAIPAGALELATASIPSTATTTLSSGVVISQTFQYTALVGAAVLFRTDSDALAWAAADGSAARSLDTGTTYCRVGGAWRRVNTGQNLLAAGAVSGANTDISSVFSTLFDSYIIEIDADVISAKSVVFAQLRAAGTVDATSGYYAEIGFANGSTVTGAAQTAFQRWQLTTIPGDVAKIRIELANPAQLRRTIGLVQSMSWDTAVGPTMHSTHAGIAHGAATGFDGIRITTNSASTITGRYRVYGCYAG